jgi:hypothetical protein
MIAAVISCILVLGSIAIRRKHGASLTRLVCVSAPMTLLGMGTMVAVNWFVSDVGYRLVWTLIGISLSVAAVVADPIVCIDILTVALQRFVRLPIRPKETGISPISTVEGGVIRFLRLLGGLFVAMALAGAIAVSCLRT